jgi:hypothetical protein
LDGVDYWTNKNSPSNSEIVFGPVTLYNYLTGKPRGYSQDSRYRGSGKFWNHDTVKYLVRFHLRRIPPLGPEGTENDTLCVIKVKVHYSYYGLLKDTIWKETLKVGEVSHLTTSAIYLGYDLAFINDNSALKGSQENDPTKIVHLGTEFIVENKTTTHQYGVEKIELSDRWIWEKYFSEADNISRMDRLTEYLTSLRTDFSEIPLFYDNKLDYVLSVDEPHSIDSHDAIMILKESLQQIVSEGRGGSYKPTELGYFVVAELNRNGRTYRDTTNDVEYYNFPPSRGEVGIEADNFVQSKKLILLK